jgi:hypothetical protein
MLKRIQINILAILTIGIMGCPQPFPSPEPPAPMPYLDGGTTDAPQVIPDGSQISTGCLLMCDNLFKLGCPEGNKGNCFATCVQIIEKRFIVLDPVCVSVAVSKEGVRSCGIACKELPNK